jgi:hypothetical protein
MAGPTFQPATSRFCSDVDLWTRLALDVPPQDLFKDLSDYRKARISSSFGRSRIGFLPFSWKEVHFGDRQGYATLRP